MNGREKTTLINAQCSTFRQLLSLMLLICLVLGCKPNVNSTIHNVKPMPRLSNSGRDELNTAIELLETMDQYDPFAAQRQAFLEVNRWIVRQPEPDDWGLDPMTKQLPSYLARVLRQSGPANLRFQNQDISYLQTHILLRDIARVIDERVPADPLVEQWISKDSSLKDEQRRDLSLAARLFDWTVRSIQLSESRPLIRRRRPSLGPQPQSANGQQVEEPKAPPPLRVGPGEMFHPSETLLKGHGDMMDRARVFILLARQHGVDVVLLAREDTNFIESTPWACAAVIGSHLYLFDTTLGLPIPRADGDGIATLAHVVANPEALRRLGTPEEPYPVLAGTVRRVTVQLEAAPQALSKRMWLVERRMAGSRKMILTAQPSQLAKRLEDFAGVENVEILQVPYVTIRFRNALGAKMKQDKKTNNPIARELLVVQGMPPLFQARLHQFRGQVGDQGDQAGAKSLYLSCRPPNESLKQLETPENKFRLQVVRAGKQCASYWIGLLTYDNTEFSVAKEWLDQRTLSTSPQGPWAHGARYNLARTCEMLQEPEQAMTLYQADDSPQRLGNRFRAMLLNEAN
ncbi:MAG: hypothetical protein MK179_17845 [Pirellulaceae bacterium]|nr:hypothetical protein [Pirellulaceae bacterium]